MSHVWKKLSGKRIYRTIVFICLYSTNSFGWGFVGHHTSAQIGLDILIKQKSTALNQIKLILGDDDFVQASTWADEARGSFKENWKHTRRYHYEIINIGHTYIQHIMQQIPEDQKKGSLVQAMIYAEDVLKNKNSTNEEKKIALKFLIHFIADAHQPLHTGPIHDSGGNKTIIKWLGFQINLHQVWDSQILAYGHKDMFDQIPKEELAAKYANYLFLKFSNVTFKTENELNYDSWIQESIKPRNEIYKYLNESEIDYTQRFLPLIDQQVYLAGYRIAFVLNRIFPGYIGPDSPDQISEKMALEFKLEVEKIIGLLPTIIRFKPSPVP